MASRKCSAKDFIFKEELGHGSYSTVYKAYDKRNLKKIYAIKVCSKSHIIKEGKVKYVTIEKNTLNLLAIANHPGIVKLHYTFHDETNLYFVLDFASGGELLSLLHKQGKFNEVWSRHFTVQLVDTLSYIHSQGVIHRDLKPENVLLDKDGRLMITDFGAALTTSTSDDVNSNEINSSASFVGTAEYVSPELLLYNQCSYGSDIWALGCMIYQFFEGHPPFRGENELKTFEKIVALDYTWNAKNSQINTPQIVVDLVRRILIIDTKERITLNAIKSNIWFKDINWNDKFTIWKGIWQLQEPNDNNNSNNKARTTARPLSSQTGGNNIPNSYQRMIPNRQLHIIDTPVKNITITKQKRKKPTKVSNTTSSIVEWRKKLGISTNINHKLPTVDMTTDIDNINNDLIVSNRIPSVSGNITMNGTASNNNKNNPNVKPQMKKQNLQPTVKENNIPQKTNQTRNISITFPKHKVEVPSSTATPDTVTISPQTKPKSKSITTPPPPLPSQVQPSALPIIKNSALKLTALNIFKQGYVYIHEIPYNPDGPGMSLSSYNQIDDDVITSFVADHQKDLKSSNGLIMALILKKNGSLFYINSEMNDEQLMVNIGDSELSVYDFEFDEEQKTGFLILEKYKYKIWFISLDNVGITSDKDEINNKETWIDCFFRVRQLLESQVDNSDSNGRNDVKTTAAKLNNITINENITPSPTASKPVLSGGNVLPPSSSASTNKRLVSNPSPTTKSSPKISGRGHLKESNMTNIRGNTTIPAKNTSTNSTSRQRHASSGSTPKQSVSQTSPATPLPHLNGSTNPSHPISLPSTLRVNTSTRKNKISSSHDSKKFFSPPLKARSTFVGSPSDTHENINGYGMYMGGGGSTSSGISSGPASPSPGMSSPIFPIKKYNAPKDMVISSSRYEVIHTLSSSHNTADQNVASSGASAAFKSLQQRKSGSKS